VPDEITGREIRILEELDRLSWSDVEPSIFGTLFERILDPAQRRQIGAHYTSRADIELIVEPVLMAPLRREWEELKQRIVARPVSVGAGHAASADDVQSGVRSFLERLASLRILDPACGSGNFLYVSLALLKALEKEVIAFASLHGIRGMTPKVHPRQLFGIEINPYAHELASVVIWIGYLQWKHRNAVPLDDEVPILQPLDQIAFMDAILDASRPMAPCEPEWPRVDVVVGNPPFVGGKRLRRALNDEYVDELFQVWHGRVPREADYCAYWFEKARRAIETGAATRVGLLATQAIRSTPRLIDHGFKMGSRFEYRWLDSTTEVRLANCLMKARAMTPALRWPTHVP
jgi:type II restriction/modification system DNA methylase subunit YeeA